MTASRFDREQAAEPFVVLWSLQEGSIKTLLHSDGTVKTTWRRFIDVDFTDVIIAITRYEAYLTLNLRNGKRVAVPLSVAKQILVNARYCTCGTVGYASHVAVCEAIAVTQRAE